MSRLARIDLESIAATARAAARLAASPSFTQASHAATTSSGRPARMKSPSPGSLPKKPGRTAGGLRAAAPGTGTPTTRGD